MKYEVKKDGITLSIDDTVFFSEQPEEFKTLFLASVDPYSIPGAESAVFDNCIVSLTELGRILFSPFEQNL